MSVRWLGILQEIIQYILIMSLQMLIIVPSYPQGLRIKLFHTLKPIVHRLFDLKITIYQVIAEILCWILQILAWPSLDSCNSFSYTPDIESNFLTSNIK